MIFLRLVRTLIAPLMFAMVVQGLGQHSDIKKTGRLGLRTLTPAIDSCISGGVNGDVATCAVLVNAIPAILQARPGLRTMVEIQPPRCFSSYKEAAAHATP